MAFAESAMSAFDDSHRRRQDRFARHGQAHVFRFWESLDAAGRARLAAQADALDLGALARAFAAARRPAGPPPGSVEPPEVIAHPALGGDPAFFAEARAAGEDWLANGRVAALVVAGGQGSRLGLAGPKGALPLGPVTGRSLFGLQAQRLRGLARRYGRPLPWLVMTSDATDAATRALFAREADFGLPAGTVRFFRQASLPVLDPEGRLLLAAPDRIAEAPDGHGGALPALVESGALAWAEERGVEVLFHYQVDNPLLPVGDPWLLGAHRLHRAEMSSKVVRRRAPGERLGTVLRENGRLRVREYSELGEPERSARGPDGELRFFAGSIGVHTYAPALVRRLTRDAARTLPLHAASKIVPGLDAAGRPFAPEAPNAIKLERFVFDALPHARRAALVEARREVEYSPVKSPRGGESPETARRALEALYRGWLAQAGVEAPPESMALEIDHARIQGPEDLDRGDADGPRTWREVEGLHTATRRASRTGDGARG